MKDEETIYTAHDHLGSVLLVEHHGAEGLPENYLIVIGRRNHADARFYATTQQYENFIKSEHQRLFHKTESEELNHGTVLDTRQS